MLGEDDDFFGDEQAQLDAASGDELDLAETVSRLNPTSDELQHFANLRNIKHDLLNRQAPFVRNNPPSVLKGSLADQVNLSITAQNFVTVGSTADGTATSRCPPVQVANWIGEDAETLPITVTVALLQQLGITSPSQPAWPYAIVQFGTRSSLVEFEVDIATGLQFTLNASAITLRLGLETFDLNGIVLPPGIPFLAAATMAGMLSFHPTTHTPQITRTRYTLSFPTASAIPSIVAVPPFSRNLSMWRSTLAATAYVIRFLNSIGGESYRKVLAAGAEWGDPTPLSGDITAISVQRTDAVGTPASEKLIFGLGF